MLGVAATLFWAAKLGVVVVLEVLTALTSATIATELCGLGTEVLVLGAANERRSLEWHARVRLS